MSANRSGLSLGVIKTDCGMCMLSRSVMSDSLFATGQAPLSMGFFRQEYWSELPFPSPGNLPDPGIKPRSPALQADALLSERPGKPTQHMPSIYYVWRDGISIHQACFPIFLGTQLVYISQPQLHLRVINLQSCGHYSLSRYIVCQLQSHCIKTSCKILQSPWMCQVEGDTTC